MNHCRTCNSDYEKPGTCNCFAPVRLQPVPVPWYPTWIPWQPPHPQWPNGTWITWSGSGTLVGQTTTTNGYVQKQVIDA